MSAISSVTSTGNPYQTTTQNGYAQIVQDFNDIGSALQSGDVSAAQTALSAFQQDLPGNSQATASQPFGQNSQANTDYQSLASALQSGNLSSAQKAFANLQKDLQSAQTSTKIRPPGTSSPRFRRGFGDIVDQQFDHEFVNKPGDEQHGVGDTSQQRSGAATSSTTDNGDNNDGRLLNALA